MYICLLEDVHVGGGYVSVCVECVCVIRVSVEEVWRVLCMCLFVCFCMCVCVCVYTTIITKGGMINLRENGTAGRIRKEVGAEMM